MAATVSVVLPCYNAQKFLGHAIESLLSQTFTDFEVIVVDDGSTDCSGSLLESYARRDNRLRIYRQGNYGIVKALNRGLSEAHGEFVARMDADDICLPERLAKQIEFMRRNRSCVAVGSDVLYIDPEGNPLIRHHPAERHEEILRRLLDGNGGALIHPSVLFRRSAITELGGYRTEWQWVEDLDLFLRLSDHGRLANLPEILLYYRQHEASVNKRYSNRDELRLKVVNPRRLAIGLEPLCIPVPSGLTAEHNWRRHWAYDAVRGGNWRSARRNAIRAILDDPWDFENWRCLRYVAFRHPLSVIL